RRNRSVTPATGTSQTSILWSRISSASSRNGPEKTGSSINNSPDTRAPALGFVRGPSMPGMLAAAPSPFNHPPASPDAVEAGDRGADPVAHDVDEREDRGAQQEEHDDNDQRAVLVPPGEQLA